jgi:hypothetical protein
MTEMARSLEGAKPRTLAFLIFHDADDARVSVVHVFGDAQAMDLHFEGADERSAVAGEFLDPDGWEIYGDSSDAAQATMRRAAAAAGVSLTVQPGYLAGLLRLPAG